jgi:hypothetical protein
MGEARTPYMMLERITGLLLAVKEQQCTALYVQLVEDLEVQYNFFFL